MITKTDWDAALDAWVAGERERLGGPPSPEEVVAYLSGELPPAEASRVRALLVYYPELTPLLAERIEKPRVVAFPPPALRVYAIAATLAIALLATDALVQRHRNAQPVAMAAHYVFTPNNTRGPARAYELASGDARYLLTIHPTVRPHDDEHEIEIVHGSRVVYRTRAHPLEEAFLIDVPGNALDPGTYTLRVRAGDRVIARYTMRVMP